QCQCTTDPFELTFNDFKPGEVYYLLLDGCASDICDFEISVTFGSTEAIEPAGLSLFGAAESCPGSVAEYFVSPGNMAGLNYQWSIEPALGTISGNGDSLVQVAWEQEGIAEVCVFADNGCATTALYCLSVLVESNPSSVSISGDTSVCLHSISAYAANPANCLGANFSWSVEGGALLSPPDSVAATVNWQTPGAGEVCLSAVSFLGDTVETCLTVAVQPAFSAMLAASEPAAEPQDSGWIQICLGDTLFLTGATLAGQNVVQNDSNFQYQWLFSDGYFLQGKTAWRLFDDPGCYEMNLQVTTPGGCEATPFLGQQIRVVGGQASVEVDPPTGICQGEQVVLQAFAESDTLFCALVAEFSDTSGIAIPDGNGAGLDETLLVNGYPAGAVVTLGFLRKICVNMEHSWMRDLEINLTCPNGQTAILHNFAGQVGGEVFLGEPFEGDEGLPIPIPGTGYDYCWTPDAANGTWIQIANQTQPNTLPSGDFSSFQPLDNFTGCPLNGEWTLEVVDLWPIDNGFLFSWSLEFAEPASDFFPVNTQ
ncbi:MAG: proprotein convertase P-domain-containing protein, partial [Bacteroidota bacterium]